jgi:8-amino-7-oxononanoate synthase
VPTLAERGDAVFADKLNHASLIDAAQLAKAQGASSYRYPHNDLITLKRQLEQSQAKRKIIVTDAVFSMDGDFAHLPELMALANTFDAWLVVDDAHGFGVLGKQGAGTLSHFGIPATPNLILMGTLGKAAGVAGAFVAGSSVVIEYLMQKARSYIFTTAAPPAVSAALVASLDIIRQGQDLRDALQRNIAHLRQGLSGSPFHLLPSATAIQPVIIGDNVAASNLSKSLWDQGLWVPAIRPPTVPQGTARLRISLSAAHTTADIDRLVAAMKEAA